MIAGTYMTAVDDAGVCKVNTKGSYTPCPAATAMLSIERPVHSV